MRSDHPGPPRNPLLCCRSLAGAVRSGLRGNPLGRCLAGLVCVKQLMASLLLGVWVFEVVRGCDVLFCRILQQVVPQDLSKGRFFPA